MNAKKLAGALAVAAGSAVAVTGAACAVLAPRHGDPVIDQQWREIARYRYAHRGLHGEGAPRTRWPRSCVPASTVSAWSSTST